jgi:peptide/nickel transport system permease protein
MKIRSLSSEIEWRARLRNWKKALYRFKKNKLSLVGLSIVLTVSLMSIFADYIAPYPQDANEATTHFGQQFQPPSMEHYFGTDEAGRDILSRIIFGARGAIVNAIWIELVVILIGLPLGILAGYLGGVLNAIIMRSADIMLTLPPLALALVAVSTFERSFTIVGLAMVLVWWPWLARLVQGKVLSLKEEQFIEASQAMGKSKLRVILEDMLPHLIPIVITKSTLDLAFTILYISSLGFVGLLPPSADWGLMISTGRKYLPNYWWLSIFPGVFLFITVFGFYLLGDGLRDFFDVRLQY